jgi:hypothetical protein
MANTSRPDVGRIYGKGDNHGFQTTLPSTIGPHEVCVYGVDSWVALSRKVGCSSVDVNGRAFGALDIAVPSPGKITVTGWALDPNTSAPISVHVYAYGKGAQALTADGPRPDIGRIFGKGDLHGFSGPVSASPGTHPVCVYAIDSWNGTNPLIKCTSVTVP